jgi:hypothetical protein
MPEVTAVLNGRIFPGCPCLHVMAVGSTEGKWRDPERMVDEKSLQNLEFIGPMSPKIVGNVIKRWMRDDGEIVSFQSAGQQMEGQS